MAYLNYQGLSTFWDKIKNTFVNKNDVVTTTEISVDTTPTASSNNLITSGAVYTAIQNVDSGGGSWGDITGTLSSQTDLQTALNSKENTSNKVTSLSSSSTDTQYPSAKAVYDEIQDSIPDVEEMTAAEVDTIWNGVTV